MRIRKRPAILLPSPSTLQSSDLSKERDEEVEGKRAWSSPDEGEIKDRRRRAEQLHPVEDKVLAASRDLPCWNHQVLKKELKEFRHSHHPSVNGRKRILKRNPVAPPFPANKRGKGNAKVAIIHSDICKNTYSNETDGCDGHERKPSAASVLMEGSRCSRVNGRGWRCSQPTLVGYALCEHHLGKGRLRSMSSVKGPSSEVHTSQKLNKFCRGAADAGKGTQTKKKMKKNIGLVKARSITSLLGDGRSIMAFPMIPVPPMLQLCSEEQVNLL